MAAERTASTQSAPAPRRSFLTNDVRFAIPAGWEDRSVIVLTAPAASADDSAETGDAGAPPAPDFSIVLHRDTPRPGEDLAAYAARQLAALRGAIPDLDVVREGARTVGGLPARELEVRWTTDTNGIPRRLRQHQVSGWRETSEGARVLTWTATAPAARYAALAPAFAALLDSVRLVAPMAMVPTTAGVAADGDASGSTSGREGGR